MKNILISNFTARLLTLFSASIVLFANFSVYAQNGNVGIGTSAPGSKLTVNGSIAGTYNSVDTNVILNSSDFFYVVNASSPRTVSLPAAIAASPEVGNILGRIYYIKNAGVANVTIEANGAELISNQSGMGVPSLDVPAGYMLMIISKGTKGAVTTWEVMQLMRSFSPPCVPSYAFGIGPAQYLTPVENARIETLVYSLLLNNIVSPSPGVYTLKKGNTYKLEAAIYIAGQGISDILNYHWFYANSPERLPNQNDPRAHVVTISGDGAQPTSVCFFTPTVDTNVDFRISNIVGNPLWHGNHSYFTITQINPCQ